MTLQDAIEKVLKENNRPLRASVIASFINTKNYYSRSDREPLQSNQILARIKNYPALFQSINGYIVLVENNTWKNLLTSYWYLVDSLRGIYIAADIQFVISVLLFYKRIVDINDRPGRKYPLDFDNDLNSSLDRMMDGGRKMLDGLRSLEIYHFAPQGIFDECARLLAKLDNYKKQEILSVIKHINTKDLDDKEFGNIFDYFITLDSVDTDKSSINQTPYSLRDLMVNILAPSGAATIYDPVAGTGGLLIDAFLYSNNTRIQLKGSEINRRIAQLGNMNLIMHGISNVEIESKDCFEEINDNRLFEFIIADLPANGITNSVEYYMLYSIYGLQTQKSGKSFGSLVLLVLSKLKDEGKAVLTVSDGFLVKKGREKEIRDLLIERDVVESVISLPYGTLRPYTDAKASIIVLNKKKHLHLKNKIKFITAKAISQNSKSLILNTEEVIRNYKSKEEISKHSQIINLNDLRSDTNLSAEAYDAEYMLANLMLKEGSGRMLSELVEIKSGLQPEKKDIDVNGDIPLVKIENLSKDILDLHLTRQLINRVLLNAKYSRSIINQECILVARIGESLKPTIFRPTTELPAIIPHSNVYVLIPKNEPLEINIEYLYYQLNSSFIQEQVEKRRLGAVMPYISIPGLKEIVVPFMKLDSQAEAVEAQKANLIAEERIRVEERISALGYKEEVKQTESDIVRTLVHQLRPTLLNIDLEVKSLKRIAEKNNLLGYKEYSDESAGNIEPEIEHLITKSTNYTLEEIINKIGHDALQLNDVLTTVNKVMSFKLTAQDFEEIDLLNFFTDYIAIKRMDVNSKFLIEVSGDHVLAQINKSSFRDLIDQLLINAEKHGFNDLKSGGHHRVQFNIKVSKDRNIIIIDYTNNGKPFLLTEKDFTSPFQKSQTSNGSGIGGNYIFRIVQAHNGKLIVKQGIKAGFALTIEIPKNQNKENE